MSKFNFHRWRFIMAGRGVLAVLLVLSSFNFAGAQEAASAKADAGEGTPIHWVGWSDAVFAQAKAEHKFVLMDLEAVWCHWCHVMDAITYADPAVRREMAAKYIAVKVDQDSRPDISNRYEDYGWPATVVFDGDGKEIVKRQGYLPPKPMLSMLEAIVDDPTPGPSVVAEQPITYASTSRIAPAVLKKVRRGYEAQYDLKAGGWGFSHKFLDADSAEYAMVLAREGDATATKRVRNTLRLEQKIQDRVWGGAYQYSAGGDWDEPHFEKLISIQAQVMRAYALGYGQFHNEAYLHTAERIADYVQGFLTSPEGAFYVSQDADLVEGEHGGEYFKLDDAGRRAKGIPRVDKHAYARENGWMIASLAELYAASGDRKYLDQAERSAEWVVAHRELEGGGFRHDEHDAAGPYLDDTLAMGQAFLALYQVTADKQWLDRAVATVPFIAANFGARNGVGYLTSKAPTDKYSQGFAERDENVALARFANLLYQYTGDVKAQAVAAQTMRYLVTPAIAIRPLSGGELLAVYETTHAPLHVTVVGAKDNEAARGLFSAALHGLRGYERLEWMVAGNEARGDMKYPSIRYPALEQPAAFVCYDGHCGSPIYL
ncbi:MAG TPA: DUF255 domain-containing protein, partial [Acidobacteriaceae bacterium]|nr:DUF255 domain-containing protein [Acidobacteriaceae bacterium]